MRITKSSRAANMFEETRAEANLGCDKCPCCGETKKWFQYMKEGTLDRGVSHQFIRSWRDGVFGAKHVQCDCYKCYSCGAEWESEPYKVS